MVEAWSGSSAGIPLGLLQIGLVINGFVLGARLDWGQCITLGALLCLIISAITGFTTTWRRGGKASEGARAGWYGGAVRLFLVALFVVMVGVVIFFSPPPPNPPHANTLPHPPELSALLAGMAFS